MKRAFKILVVLLVSVLACEGLIRLTGLYKTQSEKGNGNFVNPFKPQHQGWQYHHGTNQTASMALPEFTFEHRYDSLGYRNDSSPDSAEVLAFGDSFTEGVGAPQDSTWPALLQIKTGKQVYNAGVMGSDPGYYLKAFRHKIKNTKARDIIVLLNYSDIYDVMTRGGMERFGIDGSVHYKKAPWFLPLYQHAHTFRAFLHLVLGYDFMFNSPTTREKNISKALQTIAEILVEMNQNCAERRIKFYTYIHPIPGEYYKRLESRTDFRRIDELSTLLNSKGVDCVNLRGDLERKLYSPELWRLVSWPLDGHFNRLGYDLIADVIANHGFPVNDDEIPVLIK